MKKMTFFSTQRKNLIFTQLTLSEPGFFEVKLTGGSIRPPLKISRMDKAMNMKLGTVIGWLNTNKMAEKNFP